MTAPPPPPSVSSPATSGQSSTNSDLKNKVRNHDVAIGELNSLSTSRMDNNEQEDVSMENESRASNVKKRKQMEPKSNVWQHFIKVTNESGMLRAKCIHCSKDYFADTTTNGTSTLHAHLRTCKVYDQLHTSLAFQSINEGESKLLGFWEYDNDLIKEKFIKMIIVDELPFKFVEGAGFKEFMETCQPKFHVPSTWTVARDCYAMYTNKMYGLKAILNEPTQRICLTTDTWTSNQRINYISLTAHFIDREWKLHKNIINFFPISSHKGEVVGATIEKCLKDWGISRVLAITVDNASSNDVALMRLKNMMSSWDTSVLNCEHLHVRCVAHILKLVVQDGLKMYNESICKVRNAVRYIRQSPARLQRFKECVEFEKIEYKKCLCLDVPTRWNSTYMMLDVAGKYEKAFDRYDEQDSGYRYDLQVVNGDIISDGRPTFDDWVIVRQFASFLKVFYDLTLKISSSSFVTSNIFLEEIYAVHDILTEWAFDEISNMHLIGTKMLEKFNKYWGDPAKMNHLLYIPMVLDPRYKLEFVVFTLIEMYGEEIGTKIGKSLEETLFRMFNDYKSRFAPSQRKDVAREDKSEPFGGTTMHRSLKLKFKYQQACGMISQSSVASDLDEYLNEKPKPTMECEDFNILNWWKCNSMRFPILSCMARDVLALPISTVASESVFSTEGRVLNDFRSSLAPKMVEALICAQDWMCETEKAINIEEDSEEMDQLEQTLMQMDVNAGLCA